MTSQQDQPATQLDRDGLPECMEIGSWVRGLRDWPAGEDRGALRGWLAGLVRWSRPDGSAMFGPPGLDPERREALRTLVPREAGPEWATVLRRWFPNWSLDYESDAPLPLPAFAAKKHPLAILRANWLPKGDWLAVDHRDPAADCRLELAGKGIGWLGPSWSFAIEPGGEGADPATAASSRRLHWQTGSKADLLVWEFRLGDVRVRRLALLLRGKELALLADDVRGPAGAVVETAIPIGKGLEPTTQPDSRGIRLRRGNQGSAVIAPLALPCSPYETRRGSLQIVDGRLVLRQTLGETGRGWLPLLVSWDSMRNRKPWDWRSLTVTRQGRISPEGAATAVRVRAGDETLLFYRSLMAPTLRVALGKQTTSRFLVAQLNAAGQFDPLAQWD